MLEFLVFTAYEVPVLLFVSRPSYAATMQELLCSIQTNPPKIAEFCSLLQEPVVDSDLENRAVLMCRVR